MFSFISMNWRGEPLVNYETVVNLIEGTTNKKGLKIKASLDHNKYEVGIKISDKAMKSLQISPDQNFPKWNYTISPRAKMLKIGEENSQ